MERIGKKTENYHKHHTTEHIYIYILNIRSVNNDMWDEEDEEN